jgi:hypothetical protein
MKLMQLAKTAPKRFSSATINEGIRKQLMDAVGAMGNVTGSSRSGIISQAASGPEEDYIVGLVNAYETQ